MTSARIERLRDKLLYRGMLTSIPPGPTDLASIPERREMLLRVRPFAEAMYLVLASGADIAERERDVIRGALRALTDGMLSSDALDQMLSEFDAARAREGTDLRLDSLASDLYADRHDAELALSLAIAAAEVDGRLDAHEQALIYALAERLGFQGSQLEALLQDDQPKLGAEPR